MRQTMGTRRNNSFHDSTQMCNQHLDDDKFHDSTEMYNQHLDDDKIKMMRNGCLDYGTTRNIKNQLLNNNKKKKKLQK